jgi:hypothetical protein
MKLIFKTTYGLHGVLGSVRESKKRLRGGLVFLGQVSFKNVSSVVMGCFHYNYEKVIFLSFLSILSLLAQANLK